MAADDYTENSSNEKKPTHPEKAIEMYLSTREEELSEWTQYSHGARLGHFTRWCELTDRDDLRNLTGVDLHEYRQWRKDDGDLNDVTVHTQLCTLRVFIQFCEKLEVVDEGLSEKIMLPTITKEHARDTILESERAEKILDWLHEEHYATFDHVLMLLLWRTGARLSGLRAIDVGDYDPEEQQVHIRHRPEEGTALKNKSSGERVNVLKDETCAILDDYIDHNREDVEDEYGREPLLATSHGRATNTTLRRHVYYRLQPCQRTGECPHDKTMADCEARGLKSKPSECPSIHSPHDVRRGAITHLLSCNVPKQVVGERADVSDDVIDRHYDVRTEVQKAENRRDIIDETWGSGDDDGDTSESE